MRILIFHSFYAIPIAIFFYSMIPEFEGKGLIGFLLIYGICLALSLFCYCFRISSPSFGDEEVGKLLVRGFVVGCICVILMGLLALIASRFDFLDGIDAIISIFLMMGFPAFYKLWPSRERNQKNKKNKGAGQNGT